ncbi:hypothetical protein GGR58DRAFT_517926 [Xylaria digitata]|nr:hypothetical protein GGR58DRAFT_517926 [Xylaria digitata]
MNIERQSQGVPSASRPSAAQDGDQSNDPETNFKDDIRVMKKPSREKGFRYWDLPLEIRIMILEYLIPQRICCVRSIEYISFFPSTVLPPISTIFVEWEAEMVRRTCNLVFVVGGNVIHTEWWNKRDNQIYFPGIRVMDRWARWEEKLPNGTKMLQDATVIANVLELVEDRYRGPKSSDIFAKHIKLGSFEGVKKFQLVLLTVESGVKYGIEYIKNGRELERGKQKLTLNAAVYGDDVRAVIGLDDKRLTCLLKPIFEWLRNIEKIPSWLIRHRNGFNLIKHLRSEWEKDLKQLFEEQWLRNQTAVWSPDMFTGEHFGYKDRQTRVDRGHRAVEKLVRGMPAIQPVIMFENRWPADQDVTMQFGRRQVNPWRNDADDNIWFGRKGNDGLLSISNRRGLCLSNLLLEAGRVTLF